MYSYNNIVDKKPPRNIEGLSKIHLEGDAPSNITFTQLKEVDATMIEHLLSDAECDAIVQSCAGAGWTFWADTGDADEEDKKKAAGDNDSTDSEALPWDTQRTQAGAQDVEEEEDEEGEEGACQKPKQDPKAFRSCHTIEVDLPGFTEVLWQRLKHTLSRPKIVIDEDLDPDYYERDAEGTWEASGVCQNCLFARYLTGGHFAPHVDGTTIIDFNERSQYTLLVYLNDCMSGGETTFMTGEQTEVLTMDDQSGKFVGNGSNIVGEMKPRKGSAVIFFHDVLHEGNSVGEGVDEKTGLPHQKLIFRGDLLYKRVPPLHDSPNDRKAFEVFQEARKLEAAGDAMGAVRLFKSVRRLSHNIADVYQI